VAEGPWKSGASAPRKVKVKAGFSPCGPYLTPSLLGKIKPARARGRAPGDGITETLKADRVAEVTKMCRNIKTLFNFDPPVTDEEIRAASLQFVRKITGFNKPSKGNEEAFLVAVGEVANVSMRLLHSLETTAPPKNREEEAAKAKARAAERFGV
jgi:hypothetical protein